MCSTYLLAWTQRFNLSYANCFLGLNYGFLNKNFQEIKLFICHCSFITLAQKTTMRLRTDREIFRNIHTGHSLSEYWSIVFVHVLHWIAIHFLIHYLQFKNLQCVEFNNFLSIAVCSVLLLFHNVCPEYSWIPPEIIKFTALYSHRKRKLIEKNKEFSSILKRTDSSAFRARVCLFFFQWLFVRNPYSEVYLLFIRDQVFV